MIATIQVGELVPVLDGRLAIWHVRNPAMILGLFGDLPLGYRKVMAALLAFTGAILLAEVFTRCQRLLPERRRWAWLFIGLLSGGMLGNLGERILHWWITDFIALGWGEIWLPPGNVADLAIVLSVPVAMLVIVFELEARAHRRPHSSEQEATPQHAETLLPPASY